MGGKELNKWLLEKAIQELPIPTITVERATEQIQEQIDDPRQFSHNIISCVLRQLAQEVSQEASNQIVDDLELEEIFGIPKAEES